MKPAFFMNIKKTLPLLMRIKSLKLKIMQSPVKFLIPGILCLSISHPLCSQTPSSDTVSIKIISSAERICKNEQVTLAVQKTIAIGDILCTDGSTINPNEYLQSSKTAKGIVFWVDDTDQHGWAIHLHETGLLYAWSTLEIDIPGLPNEDDNLDEYQDVIRAYKDTAGYTNTRIIREFGTPETYPAAYAVDFENGWYLPAARQLHYLQPVFDQMNTSLRIVGGTLIETDLLGNNCDYWSSTEVSHRAAAIGKLLWSSLGVKTMPAERVRAVCTF